MSLQVNNNAPSTVNWESLLSKVGELTKANKAGEAPILKFTMNVDGTDRTFSVKIPDDIGLPDAVDSDAIKTLCAKLAVDAQSGLDAATAEQLRQVLVAALSNPDVTKAAAALGNSKSVMFDLYALMALLVDCAQKQRDATRALRTAESQQIQNSIQAQAGIQRSAAIKCMVASAICCVIQGVAMGISLYKQASAFKTQLASMETSGIGSARQNLNMTQTGETADGAQKQFVSIRKTVGPETATRVGASFEQADIATAQAQVREVQINQEAAKLQRVQNLAEPLRVGDIPQNSALETAHNRYVEFQELQQLQGQQNPNEADTQRLNTLQAKYQNVTAEQIETELNTARTQYGTELQQTLQNDRTAYNAGRVLANNKLNAAVKTYENAYDNAVRERANVTADTPKAEIQRLDQNLERASKDLQFARAYAANQRIGVTTVEERQMLTSNAEARLTEAQALLRGDTSYIKAGRIIQSAEGTNQLITAVGNCVQGLIQSYGSIRQADATEENAYQKQLEEQREQVKDLYNQAGDLVDAALQLMQAVSTAETQSMHDAIQA